MVRFFILDILKGKKLQLSDAFSGLMIKEIFLQSVYYILLKFDFIFIRLHFIHYFNGCIFFVTVLLTIE